MNQPAAANAMPAKQSAAGNAMPCISTGQTAGSPSAEDELHNNCSEPVPLDSTLQQFERVLERVARELDKEHAGFGKDELFYRDQCVKKLQDDHGFSGAKEIIVLDRETDPMSVSGPFVRRTDMLVPLSKDVAVLVEFKANGGNYSSTTINNHTGQLRGYMRDGQKFGFRHPSLLPGGWYGQGPILRYTIPIGFLVRFDKADKPVPFFMRKVGHEVNKREKRGGRKSRKV